MALLVTDRVTPKDAGLPDPTHHLFGQGEDPPADDPPQGSEEGEELDPEDLQRQLEDRDRQLEDANRRLDTLIESRPGSPEPSAATPRAPTPPPSPGPMPDPTTESEAFAKWMDARDKRRDFETNQRLEGIRQEGEDALMRDRLWTQFQRDYPDEARDEVLVRAAFNAVSNGRVPADVPAQERMLKDIAERLRPKPKADEPKPDDDTDPKPNRSAAADRTGGLSRGSRVPRKRTSPEPKKPRSLSEAIGDRQVNTPFY